MQGAATWKNMESNVMRGVRESDTSDHITCDVKKHNGGMLNTQRQYLNTQQSIHVK